MQTPQNLAEVIAHIAKQEQAKLAAQIGEAQEKLLTTSFDKAATYTTVIIFGGYAGFFALWQLSKDYLSKEQALWSALLILISLLSFVLFEVAKMILVTKSVFGKLAPLKNPAIKNNPQLLLQEDRIFKRHFSFPMAPRTQPSTPPRRSLKVAQDC